MTSISGITDENIFNRFLLPKQVPMPNFRIQYKTVAEKRFCEALGEKPGISLNKKISIRISNVESIQNDAIKKLMVIFSVKGGEINWIKIFVNLVSFR